ncbi:rab-like protein 6 [Anabrus simplex]|uniref:rab-like protein 6 n=1 Tax=Anabrus simplex TaxID=316456 RepID=UPI0034DD2E89
MLTALKQRLTGRGDGPSSNAQRPSHQTMSHSLQRKFARGVQYNMKIIIKGDRNVGKTCLFQRLQGQKFVEEYIPTEEIQVASIQWNYKATDDVVKVEVWDVVDRGKKKKRFDGLKLDNSQLEMPEEPALDAEFLDVYKGTNGVIIMMDITKSWTFDYIQRELPKVPNHIPVLVLANHCDMSHHRTITSDHVTYFIESFNRPPGSAQVRYAEASMRNGFGLKLLHKFFNLPFLQLQRETLLAQLETNEQETLLTSQELDLYQESDDADYNKFLDNLMNKRRQVADLTSSAVVLPNAITPPQSFGSNYPTSSQSSHQLSTVASSTENTPSVRRSMSITGPIGGGNPIPGFNPVVTPKTPEQQRKASPPASSVPPGLTGSSPCLQTPTPQPPEPAKMENVPKPSGFISKIFGKTKESQEDATSERRPSLASTSGSVATPEPITSVEEFVPDGGMIDRSFLEDTNVQERSTPQHQMEPDSDSDLENGNPLVAGFQDDLDPEDILPPTTTIIVSDDSSLKKEESLSSSGEGEKENAPVITSEAFDTWLASDSKWQHNPDGGEDSDIVIGTNLDDETVSTSPTSSNVHLELLEPRQMHCSSGGSSPVPPPKEKKKDHHKDKNEEKSGKKHKKKSKEASSSNEEKKKKKKRSSRRSREEERSRDELEEFLNGPGTAPVDTAYEAI